MIFIFLKANILLKNPIAKNPKCIMKEEGNSNYVFLPMELLMHQTPYSQLFPHHIRYQSFEV